MNSKYYTLLVLFYAFFIALLLAGCNNLEPEKAGTMDPLSESSHGTYGDFETTEDPSEEDTPYVMQTYLPASGPMTHSEQVVHDTLNNAIGYYYDVQFDSDTLTYNMMAYPGQMDDSIEFIMEGELHDEWHGFLFAMQEHAYYAIELVGYGYTFNILNPYDGNRVLASFVDGVLIYDFSQSY